MRTGLNFWRQMARYYVYIYNAKLDLDMDLTDVEERAIENDAAKTAGKLDDSFRIYNSLGSRADGG
jgi:hypothetical protein